MAPRLEPLTGHHDSRIRREALRALQRLLNEDAAATILAALDDPDSEVRRHAAGLLREMRDPEVDRVLERRAADPGLGIADRLIAVNTLGRRGTAAAGAALGELARRRFVFARTERAVRRAARGALGSGS